MTITSAMIRQWGDEARERNEPQSADHLHQAAFVVARLNMEIGQLRTSFCLEAAYPQIKQNTP